MAKKIDTVIEFQQSTLSSADAVLSPIAARCLVNAAWFVTIAQIVSEQPLSSNLPPVLHYMIDMGQLTN